MVQAHIFYSGTVQGVGFRYTAQRIASRHSLEGWVKNLADGRVELLAQGEEGTIDEFCRDLEEEFEGYIKDKKILVSQTQTTLGPFHIAH